MSRFLKALIVPMLLAACDRRVIESPPDATTGSSQEANAYAHTVNSLGGEPVDLGQYRGQVSLMVNVASACGFTPQYEKLQELQEIWQDRGFTVIAFPCNDFGRQEPGDAEDIKQTCRVQYGATFPVMTKISVKNGPNQSPIYTDLEQATGALPRWNFGKYLVDADGHPIAFFGSSVDPMSAEIQGAIEKALAKGTASASG
ncbi:MAG: glutathione peroxidase [Phycisphaerales bacterium]|nr:glutathione peroxidase [Phycisphaerales bacterium]